MAAGIQMRLFVETEEEPPARTGVVALILVNLGGDTRHRGYEVLRRGVSEAQARAICSDARTRGDKHSVMWTDEANLGDDWRWRDDGRYDGVLAEYGVTWKREGGEERRPSP